MSMAFVYFTRKLAQLVFMRVSFTLSCRTNTTSARDVCLEDRLHVKCLYAIKSFSNEHNV